VKVLKKEYVAGPFPLWNCWVKDPLLARGLANEIELFLGAKRECARSLSPSDGERAGVRGSIWFVAHSNGAVIALLAARRLITRGHKIGGLILTGAACEADVEKNEIMEWLRNGKLGAAIAYSSADDAVLDGDPAHSSINPQPSTLNRVREWLWGKLMWPYGCLGRTGWLYRGTVFNPSLQHSITPPLRSISTRWFPGGHSAYFAAQNINRTFEQIYQDVENVGSAENLTQDTRSQSRKENKP
jgi:pimeloyl-ACP methyl ester carboxylesterase